MQGSFWARLKTVAGGHNPLTTIIVATDPGASTYTDLVISGFANSFYIKGVSGTCSVGTINANLPVQPGREIYLEAPYAIDAAVVLKNNAASTTKGQLDIGTGDITLGITDAICLAQRADGVWVRQYSANN